MSLEIMDDSIFFNGTNLSLYDNNSIEIEDEFKEAFFNLRVKEIPRRLECYYYSSLNKYNVIMARDNGTFSITLIFPINMINWNKNISLREYSKLIEDKFSKFNGVSISTDIVDYDLEKNINIFYNYILDEETILKDALLYILDVYEKFENEILFIKNIVSMIYFKQEHLSAGLSILQYFGKLLKEKYPNENVSVSIKQEGLKIIMVIETPDGKKEEIEEYLNRYGLVISNQITPQEFTSNPIQLLELKQEIRDAKNKIQFQQELLILKDDTYKNRIISLEEEVTFLRTEFSNALLHNQENIQTLLGSLLTKDKLIKRLTKSIEKRDNKKTKQLLLELKEKDTKGYTSLKEHINNIVAGNLTNTPAWMELLITHFPK